MSVYDVAAIDRLNSLPARRSQAGRKHNIDLHKARGSWTHVSANHHSLPTSPIRDKKTDVIKDSLAKYQASLSRPDSPTSSLGQNDDIPSNSRRYQAPPCRRPADLQKRSAGYKSGSAYSHQSPPGGQLTNQHRSADFQHRSDSRSGRGSGGYTVSSTRTTSSIGGEYGSKERLWDTLPARGSDHLPARGLDHLPVGETDQDHRLGAPRAPSNSSQEDIFESNLLDSRYPYISSTPSHYSLPRNTRLAKANKNISSTLRASQDNLNRTSQLLAGRESRETLLKRYPSAAKESSSPYTRYSGTSSHSATPLGSPSPRRVSSLTSQSLRSSRNSSPLRNVSSQSARCSRQASPENYSLRYISSARSSRNTSPRSSRNTSPSALSHSGLGSRPTSPFGSSHFTGSQYHSASQSAYASRQSSRQSSGQNSRQSSRQSSRQTSPSGVWSPVLNYGSRQASPLNRSSRHCSPSREPYSPSRGPYSPSRGTCPRTSQPEKLLSPSRYSVANHHRSSPIWDRRSPTSSRRSPTYSRRSPTRSSLSSRQSSPARRSSACSRQSSPARRSSACSRQSSPARSYVSSESTREIQNGGGLSAAQLRELLTKETKSQDPGDLKTPCVMVVRESVQIFNLDQIQDPSTLQLLRNFSRADSLQDQLQPQQQPQLGLQQQLSRLQQQQSDILQQPYPQQLLPKPEQQQELDFKQQLALLKLQLQQQQVKSEPAVLPQAENPICQQPPEIDFQQHLALLKRQQQSEQSIRIQQQQQPQPTIHQLQPEISLLKQEQPPQPDEKQLQTEQQPLLQQHEKAVQQQHQDSELNLQILSHPLPVHEVDVIVQSEQQQQQTHIQFQSVLQQPCQQQQQSELQQPFQQELEPLCLKANAEDQPQPQQQIAPHRKDQLDQSVEVGLKAAEPEDDTSDYREDMEDSGRAESIISSAHTSISGIDRAGPVDGLVQADPHSTIRRQSVIIEGLSLEAEELKRKVETLEDELGSVPMVDQLQDKLGQMEHQLEETETFCYQVVEENVTLKSEIETLESEISEVQDSFRDKDAKEFKRVKWELENLAKNCRNLQIKLGRTQAKAVRLRHEKEDLEERQKEAKLWKTTAVVAAAILAGFSLLSGKMK